LCPQRRRFPRGGRTARRLDGCTSPEARAALREGTAAQEWGGAVALLVVVLVELVHRPEHAVEAQPAAELDRARRPVQPELDAGVDVVGRAHALAERERSLVHDAALDPVEDA